MDNLASMFWIELLKSRRSKVPLLISLAFLMMPIAAGLMIFILKDPEFARKVGIISMKAQLFGTTADWPTYTGMLAMMIALGGMIFFSLLCSWVFGREFSDGTIKDWLAVPVSRSSIILAKFGVVAVWSTGLVLETILVGVVMGLWIGITGNTPEIILDGVFRLAVTALLTIALTLPFAFFAGVGRGYLLPVGITMLTLIAAEIIATMGWGSIFPWSIPGVYSDFTKGANEVGALSYGIVAMTSLAGIAATWLWYQQADQNR